MNTTHTHPQQAGGDNRPTSGLATTAMVLGIISLPLACLGIGIVTGIVALILGIMALGRTGDPPYAQKGKGLAITGLTLGGTSILLGPVAVVLMIGIMLPALGAARRTARQVQNSSQLRQIHLGMLSYAMSNQAGANAGWYPGLDAQGRAVDLSVEHRFGLLLDAGYVAPDYLLNPADVVTTPYDYNHGGPLTAHNYSYAMLNITQPGGRRDEWRETYNFAAVVLADRDTTPMHGPPGSKSVWSDAGWRGSIARNDGAVMFEHSHIIPQTQYGQSQPNQQDDLFTPSGTDDAWLIHEGK